MKQKAEQELAAQSEQNTVPGDGGLNDTSQADPFPEIENELERSKQQMRRRGNQKDCCCLLQ